jgi:hypothetical protein
MNEGWKCPQCGACLAPWVDKCDHARIQPIASGTYPDWAGKPSTTGEEIPISVPTVWTYPYSGQWTTKSWAHETSDNVQRCGGSDA